MNRTDDIKQFLDGLIKKSTPERPAWNLEVLLGHIEPAWNYIDGCMIKAVLEMYDITGDKAYLEFADSFVGYYVDDDGKMLGYKKEDYNCDNINEGKVLFTLLDLTGREKYKKAIEILYEQLLTHPRTKAGNFWHKKIYPNQVWLDGLYMVQPFYTEYEMKFNASRNYRDMFSQFENVYSLMRDKKTGLLYHGYDESRESFWADKETGCSPNFWTRSLGWYAMALVDTIEKLDEQFFNEYQTLQQYLKDLIDALLNVADKETGMFYQVTDQGGREGNYLETSGTCAIAYSLMKAARLGYIPSHYYGHGERIFRSVAADKLELKEDGFSLKDICLVAGLGGIPGRGDYKLRDGTYEYYISEPKVENDAKGVAPFLLAFTEVYRKESSAL